MQGLRIWSALLAMTTDILRKTCCAEMISIHIESKFSFSNAKSASCLFTRPVEASFKPRSHHRPEAGWNARNEREQRKLWTKLYSYSPNWLYNFCIKIEFVQTVNRRHNYNFHFSISNHRKREAIENASKLWASSRAHRDGGRHNEQMNAIKIEPLASVIRVVVTRPGA